ncbi:hypothetical protein JXA84_04025 [candidate division WOR-3 bacterium]|nr:hypothetical protein [candidate division WOR-3 bacterium]
MKKKYIKPSILDFKPRVAQGNLFSGTNTSSPEGGCTAGSAADYCNYGQMATGFSDCANGSGAMDCTQGALASGNLCATGTNATGGGGGFCASGSSPLA